MRHSVFFFIVFSFFLLFNSPIISQPQNQIVLNEGEYNNISLSSSTLLPKVDLSIAYCNKALVIKATVKDNHFKDGDRSWRYGDGFYINFVTPDENEEGNTDKFLGFGFSLINNKPVSVLVNKDGTYFPKIAQPPLPQILIDSLNMLANYTITIPWECIYPFHPLKDNSAGINIVYISQNDDGSRIIQQLIEDNYDTELTNKRKFVPLKFISSAKNDFFFTGELENRVRDNRKTSIALFVQSPKRVKTNFILEIEAGNKVLLKKTITKQLTAGKNKLNIPITLPKDDGLLRISVTANKNVVWSDSLYKYSNIKLHHSLGIIRILCDSTLNGQINFSGNTLTYNYNELTTLIEQFDKRKDISLIKNNFENLYSLIDLFTQEKTLLKKSGYLLSAFLSEVDSTLQPYSIIIPDHFDITNNYTLVFALHGSGVDEISFIKNVSKIFSGNNFIITAPRGRDLSSWYAGNTEKDAVTLIKYLKHLFNINNTILYGFSMGGYGVWRLGLIYPEFFDYGTVVSGIPFNPRDEKPEYNMNNYFENSNKKIPFLVIHGTNDKSLNISYTDEFVEKLLKSGYEIDYKKIVNGGHGNFDNKEIILEWLNKINSVNR